MNDIELGSVISLIMENPELVAEIKRLAESGSDKTTETSKEVITEAKDADTVMPISEAVKPSPERHTKARGKRSELLHALSPYISEGRQKALETFMTIADILDMMREK